VGGMELHMVAMGVSADHTSNPHVVDALMLNGHTDYTYRYRCMTCCTRVTVWSSWRVWGVEADCGHREVDGQSAREKK
jgi:hypothetical protein